MPTPLPQIGPDLLSHWVGIILPHPRGGGGRLPSTSLVNAIPPVGPLSGLFLLAPGRSLGKGPWGEGGAASMSAGRRLLLGGFGLLGQGPLWGRGERSGPNCSRRLAADRRQRPCTCQSATHHPWPCRSAPAAPHLGFIATRISSNPTETSTLNANV